MISEKDFPSPVYTPASTWTPPAHAHSDTVRNLFNPLQRSETASSPDRRKRVRDEEEDDCAIVEDEKRAKRRRRQIARMQNKLEDNVENLFKLGVDSEEIMSAIAGLLSDLKADRD